MDQGFRVISPLHLNREFGEILVHSSKSNLKRIEVRIPQRSGNSNNLGVGNVKIIVGN